MLAYIYQADIYCEDCGKSLRARIDSTGDAPDYPNNEETYDSDDYPKGPYPDGGGEADTAQHCGACHVALDNPVIGSYDDERFDALS